MIVVGGMWCCSSGEAFLHCDLCGHSNVAAAAHLASVCPRNAACWRHCRRGSDNETDTYVEVRLQHRWIILTLVYGSTYIRWPWTITQAVCQTVSLHFTLIIIIIHRQFLTRRNTTKSLKGRASTQWLMTCHTKIVVSRHISVRSCQWWRGKTLTRL